MSSCWQINDRKNRGFVKILTLFSTRFSAVRTDNIGKKGLLYIFFLDMTLRISTRRIVLRLVLCLLGYITGIVDDVNYKYISVRQDI